MSKRNIISKIGFQVILILGVTQLLPAQEKSQQAWDLNQCLNYALEHNIQVNKKKLTVLSSEADLLKTKSDRLPNLSGTISESFTNSKVLSAGNGSPLKWDLNNGTTASLSSNLTVYNGGVISNSIKQSQLNIEMANLDIELTKNSITLSITQAYLNALYAKESVDYAKEILITSQKQVERAQQLLKAGSIAKTDQAQLEAQYASDQYSLVIAQNTLISNITSLKQLLEIPVTDTFYVAFPEIDFDKEYSLLPSINEAFNTSLSVLPDMKFSELNKSVAEIGVKIAKAGYLPSLSMNANYSTSFSSLNSKGFNPQLTDNQTQKIGLALNIPIFSKNITKTTIQRSRINLEQADLTMQETKKNLLQNVESVYQNTIAGKSRYDAAVVQFSSANESYKLSEAQFNLGMINTVDLLKVKNTILNAKKELIQAKYSAILNRKILDFYMGKPISL
ncbi:MAG: TolC family protein [Bacteroidales bacterium]|nr:TolC family protein [Bacteroidales bacterium]